MTLSLRSILPPLNCKALLLAALLCVMASAARAQEGADSVLDVKVLLPVREDVPAAQEATDSVDDGLDYFRAAGYTPMLEKKREFNPDPTRAVWFSALFPGLGQVYNRRYWKLPIIVAGYMGLGYATSWNNGQLSDYSQAYRDLMDADPSTNSYMNFFPPTTGEADLDREWLQSVMRSRRDYYRRNRDLCIIAMVGVYLLCMIDAYVDATMAHFDISPDLSMDVQPAIFQAPGDKLPAVGVQWALNF